MNQRIAGQGEPSRQSDPRQLQLAGGVAMAVAIAVLTTLIAIALRDGGTDGIGGLQRFREDGSDVEAYGFVLLALAILVVGFAAALLVTGGRLHRFTLLAVVAAKVLLLLAVIFMFAFPDLSQFEGKSLTYRAILYPTLAFAPLVLHVLRAMSSPYPALFDFFLTFALLFDIVSNDLHYYGTWLHWDDGVHYANSVPMMILLYTAVAAVERTGRILLGFWGVFIFAFTIYTSIHALWEMEEFALDRFFGTNLQPGGMEEATRNNVAGLLGGLTAIPVLLWWRSLGTLHDRLIDPFHALFARHTT